MSGVWSKQKMDAVGLIAIIIGVMLAMSGSMFALVTSLMPLPRTILIPPTVQIGLALVTIPSLAANGMFLAGN
jgi:hypothetical protein